jgi:hypothetical protein
MKRSWTALAVALVAFFAMAGCNDYGNTFQNNTGAFLSFLSPSQISAGGGDFVLTITGIGFVPKTKVQWNGTICQTSGTGPCKTTVTLDANNNVVSVTATITAALIAKPGIASVSTVNPASGTGNNGLSNPINFIINPPPNPLPTLTSLSPNAVVGGSATPLTLTLTGTNFLSNSDPAQASSVNWSMGGVLSRLATGSVTATTIQATVPASLLANSGTTNITASVSVSNPPSPPPPGCTGNCNGGGGGGSSSSTAFTICPSSQSSCVVPAANPGSAAAMVSEETPAVSVDGRYVAYTAVQDGHAQIFLRDTCESAPAGCQSVTTLLSVSGDGSAASGDSRTPSMSSDGRYVAFSSAAANLVENAPTGRQIYLRDTCAGVAESCKPSTQLISTDSNGALVGTENILPSVSSSGRFIAFLAVTPSHATNHASSEAKPPVADANSGYRQVFIRDTCLGAANCTPKTTRISLQPGDGTGTDAKSAGPALSGNARRVAIAGGNMAMLFTRSVAVDDRVFLAVTKENK